MTNQKLFLSAGAIAIYVVCLAIFGCGRKSTQLLPPQFDDEELVVANLPIKDKTNLVVGIQNPNAFDIRIVGIAGSCGPGGCAEPVEFLPFVLGSGETKSITVEVKSPHEPGPIKAMMLVHYSTDSVRHRELLITGNAVDLE